MSTMRESDLQRAAEQDVSLRQLSDAFARAVGKRPPSDAAIDISGLEEGAGSGGAAEAGSCSPAEGVVETESPAGAVGQDADNDPCEIAPISILEAMLFVGNPASESLTSECAAQLMRGVAPEEISGLVEDLNRRYTVRGCPYHIISEGAGYRMTLCREYGALRNRFYGRVREARLSQVAIDVLAIVAYRQPITAEQVNQHRGRPCNQLLHQLVRRRLLRVQRDSGAPRVARYCTTDRFLGVFGLASLNDLPRSDDV